MSIRTKRAGRIGGAALMAAALMAGATGCGSVEASGPNLIGPEAGNGRGNGNVNQVVPGRTQPTLPPVAKGKPAQYGNGVDVTLVGEEPVDIVGEGPGERSGPGVLYTLQLHNQSGSQVGLEGTTVTAMYGSGSPVGPALAVGAPFTGTLGPGKKAEGSYAFLVPADERGTVTLYVTFSTDVPVASITLG